MAGNPGSQKTATEVRSGCALKTTSENALATAALPMVFKNFRLGNRATDLSHKRTNELCAFL
jgi:hypothetical protein